MFRPENIKYACIYMYVSKVPTHVCMRIYENYIYIYIYIIVYKCMHISIYVYFVHVHCATTSIDQKSSCYTRQ